MDDSHGKRGYALSGLMCLGTLACGPETPTGEAGTESTGYPLTTESSTSSESDEGSQTETETETETETGTQTETETDSGEPDCYTRGDVCGEMTVCQCSCDWSADCCICEATTCTDDAHCSEGEVCDLFIEDHHAYSLCVLPVCEGATSIYAQGPDADLTAFSDLLCARDLDIVDTTMIVDLAPLASLQVVVDETHISWNTALPSLDGLAITSTRVLEIVSNDSLTNIDALTSLESIEEGVISCNPLLPTDHIEAVLAQIPGGDQVQVVDNGEGPC